MNRNVAVWRFSIANKKGKKEQTPMYSVFYVKKFNQTGKTISRILSYAPERKHLKKFQSRKEAEWYDPKHTDYSGLFLVSLPNGVLLHGINFENGHHSFLFRPNLHQHTTTRTATFNKQDSSLVSSFSMRLVTSDSSIRTYSYDDESGELAECVICKGDSTTCDCFNVTYCQDCNNKIDECTCCSICGDDPCSCPDICSQCGSDLNFCTCSKDDSNEGNSGSGSGTGGGGSSNNDSK